MTKYWVGLMLSILYAIIVDGLVLKTPFPAGVYTGTRYRISSEEPNAQISTKIEVTRQGKVDQKITLKDESTESFAAFRFDGGFDSCDGFRCNYTRRGSVLLKSDIHQPIFQSKYIELLSKSKGKKKWTSEVDLLLKSKDVVIVFDVENSNPYLYAIDSKKGL
ncbi:hypothetical protein K8D10_22715 [Aeromonas veronii]|uniref:hypothetical protein n=1 Tax=Aeromonas veronii TaxID=654 RepID=UPI00207D45F6|nr:hypothetical protein [Aeromonas veronii]MCO4174557.1 hypothetical protein [Aeromonas veronii]